MEYTERTNAAVSLKNKLASPPAPPTPPPSGWQPHVDISDTGATIITKSYAITGPAGSQDEVDLKELLEEHGLTPSLWSIKSHSSSRWQVYDGSWRESHRITAEPTSARFGIDLPDLDDLHKAVRRSRVKRPENGSDGLTAVVVLSDLQVGKAHDARGGTEEMLERVEDSRLKLIKYVKKLKPAEIVLVDAGDPIENFESTAQQDRTNDLSLTEQIRVWRRVLWTWVDTIAALAPSVKVVAVGSNHGRVRRGKNPMGPPSDDYGIEALAQVADIASANPELYRHVSFHVPPETDEALAVQLTGGKVLGVVHGHQVSNIDKISDWWRGQSHGRTPVGAADFLIHGHFHQMRVSTSGDDRWIFGAPTADAGSAWFRNLRGHESAPGVMTFCVGPDGWGGLTLC